MQVYYISRGRDLRRKKRNLPSISARIVLEIPFCFLKQERERVESILS